MAKWRQAVELAMTDEEADVLTALSRSRTEPASRVSRAAMLLAYRENPSFFAVGQRLRVHHQTVQSCVERAVAYGALTTDRDRCVCRKIKPARSDGEVRPRWRANL
jgi:hypothetical protein